MFVHFILFQLFFVYAFCSCGDDYCDDSDVDVTDRSDWMYSIPDDTSLNLISTPGTHDSATYANLDPSSENLFEPFELAWIKTQAWDFKKQLKAGIRFFDLRLCVKLLSDVDDGVFRLCHGPYIMDLSTTDVLDNFRDFLNDHPYEVIIVTLKNEGGSGWFGDTYINMKDKHGRLGNDWLLMDSYTSPPYIQYVRGKVVVIWRSDDIEWGLHWGTADNTQNDNTLFKVEDYYQQHMDTLDTKKEHISTNMRGASENTNGWYFTFTSATGDAGDVLAYPSNIAYNINSYVKREAEAWDNLVGTVIMDFPGDDLIGTIIGTNAWMWNNIEREGETTKADNGRVGVSWSIVGVIVGVCVFIVVLVVISVVLLYRKRKVLDLEKQEKQEYELL